MKPEKAKIETKFLDQLTSKSKNFKVKTTLTSKDRPQQSPTKPVKYQRLTFQDEKGNVMKATLFNKDIEDYDHILQEQGEYEIAEAVIKPVDDKYRTKTNEFQMSFNDKTIIQPIHKTSKDLSPKYFDIASIPRAANRDQKFDVLGVVIFVEETRKVRTSAGTEIDVREIVIADNSTEQTMIISAWNDLCGQDCNILSTCAPTFATIGFTNLKISTHKGFSLATIASTRIIHDPIGEKADALRAWTNENRDILEDRLAKVLEVRNPSKERSITTIGELRIKKAHQTMQEEQYWLKVVVPEPAHKDLNIYLGCDNCSKRMDLEKGSKFSCPSCGKQESISTPRKTFNFEVDDGSGTLSFTAFNDEAASMLQTTAIKLYDMKRDDELKVFYKAAKRLQKEHFYIKVGPSIALANKNILRWKVKSVVLE